MNTQKEQQQTCGWWFCLSPLGGDQEFIFVKEEPAFYI